MQIRVASLNFSGINISPFEYYDGTHQKDQLNVLFRELLEERRKDYLPYSADMAKIDKNFQKNRYTILYRQDVGVVRGRLLNKQQFEAVWDLTYDNNHPTDENYQKNQKIFNPDALDKLKTFDIMMYEAFLSTLFGEIDWNNIKNYDSQLYLQQLSKCHSKTYLQLDLKVDCLFEYITTKDLDVLFVQEAEIHAITRRLPSDYFSVHSEKSMIIVKKSFLQNDSEDQLFRDTFAKSLNFNKDSCYLKVKNYLLLSIHLSSKKVKAQQAQTMKKTLSEVMEYDPVLKLIIGIDANQFLQTSEFNIYPLTKHHITTRKRRTDMQLQFQKSGIIVQDVKDHILTNLTINSSKIETVKSEQIGDQLLPNQKHPFDHFVVYSSIIDQSIYSIRESLAVDIMDLPSPLILKKTNTTSTAATSHYQKTFKSSKKVPVLLLTQKHNIQQKVFQDQNNHVETSRNYKKLLFPASGLFQFKSVNRSKSSRKRSCQKQYPQQNATKHSHLKTERHQPKYFTTKIDQKSNTASKTTRNLENI